MNDVKPTPKREWTSLASLDAGDTAWMVNHNDNSDYGRTQVYFETPLAAYAYAQEVTQNPPGGNYFHLAPGTLNLRVFKVECLATGVPLAEDQRVADRRSTLGAQSGGLR